MDMEQDPLWDLPPATRAMMDYWVAWLFTRDEPSVLCRLAWD